MYCVNNVVVGDLRATEITMNDDDRIQLMLLVKEGKISVQEAVDTVRDVFILLCDACRCGIVCVLWQYLSARLFLTLTHMCSVK